MITNVDAQIPARTCRVCKQEKPLTEFNKHRGRRDGHAYRCRKCSQHQAREWYRRNQLRTNGLYSTYMAMKQRCYNKEHDSFPMYGGRGIRVCDRWLASFDAFHRWAVQNGHRPGLQLDRIDNDKGYGPDNCRFVTPAQNARNKRPRTRTIRTNPTLTVNQVREARKLLAEGVSQREIGRRLGVTHGTIGAIKTGRTWADVS